MSNRAVRFIGLDVSSKDAWAAMEGAKPKRFLLSCAGAQSLLAWAGGGAGAAALLCVMEHTGVYSVAWAGLLRRAGADTVQFNPARIKSFAAASGFRSKTDRCDCKAILAFALHTRPLSDRAPDPAQAKLAMLLSQRAGVKKQLSALACRRHALSFLEFGGLVEGELAELDAALAVAAGKLEHKVKDLIRSDPRLSHACALLLSIPGVGKLTAWQLCTRLDDLLERSGPELTALAGLAPAQRQSGSRTGKARIDKQGSAVLRRALYMASLSAVRCCPPVIELKARLKDHGKAPKVILIAGARKLLLIARAVLAQDAPFHTPA